jgi:aryl-alcohol dehydrogenase (NADP+)
MQYRTLGRTGIKVSPYCLGAMMLGGMGNPDHEDSTRIIHKALDAGINFIDTADRYSAGESEEIVGKALKGRRDGVVLATKFGHDLGDGETRRGSRAYIRRAVEASLRRLRTDRIDLYQYHRPDGVTPLEETLGALHELVQEGTVRAIGSSNFTAALVEEAHGIAAERSWTPFATEQSEYSWLKLGAEEELLPACVRLGVGFIPYFPLASGILTGKYRKGEPAPEGTRLAQFPQERAAEFLNDDALDRVERLRAHAESQGHTVLELAMSWLVDNPVVSSVIAGATSPEQVDANVAAVGWALTDADRAAVDDIAPVP